MANASARPATGPCRSVAQIGISGVRVSAISGDASARSAAAAISLGSGRDGSVSVPAEQLASACGARDWFLRELSCEKIFHKFVKDYSASRARTSNLEALGLALQRHHSVQGIAKTFAIMFTRSDERRRAILHGALFRDKKVSRLLIRSRS